MGYPLDTYAGAQDVGDSLVHVPSEYLVWFGASVFTQSIIFLCVCVRFALPRASLPPSSLALIPNP